VPLCYRARPRIPHVEKKPLNRPPKTARWERARGDEVQRVRIEPQQLRVASPVASHALGAAGRCDPGGAAAPRAKSNCAFTIAPARTSYKERTENEKEDEDAVEKKDEDWAHDCTIDIVSPHLGSCITRHTYLIGSLWRVLISSCESHRRCSGGENRREHRHLSTPTARSHPLPRQLLQSNIWAHPQQYSAQIARTNELTRKHPGPELGLLSGGLREALRESREPSRSHLR